VSLAQASKRAGAKNAFFLPELLKQRPTLEHVPPKQIWAACLHDASDDIMAMCATLLAGSDAAQPRALRQFCIQAHEAVDRLLQRLADWGETARRQIAPASPSFEAATKDQQHALLQAGSSSGWSHKLILLTLQGHAELARVELLRLLRLLLKKALPAIEEVLELRWQTVAPARPRTNSTPPAAGEEVAETRGAWRIFCDLDVGGFCTRRLRLFYLACVRATDRRRVC